MAHTVGKVSMEKELSVVNMGRQVQKSSERFVFSMSTIYPAWIADARSETIKQKELRRWQEFCGFDANAIEFFEKLDRAASAKRSR